MFSLKEGLLKKDFRKYNGEDLKFWMWVEVCEGKVVEFDKDYKEFVSKFGEGELEPLEFIVVFYKILDWLEGKYLEFKGGDVDWLSGYFEMFNCEDKFKGYWVKYNAL